MRNVFKGMTFMIVAGVIIRLVSNDLGVIVFGGIILGAFASMVAKAVSLNREIKKAGIKVVVAGKEIEEISGWSENDDFMMPGGLSSHS